MKRLLQKWLGIDKDLELERYVSTQAQLAQLARWLGDTTGTLKLITSTQEKLTEATEALANKTKLNADEIAGLKEALEYITKDLVEIKKASKK
ncbi:hypothetical protein [Helicobacter canis]|uniref:Uncharacterized protein n=1 Tax=Helicobacter canis TaxID=29419 RepID=A0A377J1H0_9HELI|nr:hypothetical protein [Helicobacter canis]STO96228.1 Uncharacterised protein [Helicobacter canis]STP06457.1 Uncharacterised protein [Helicobacter canis]